MASGGSSGGDGGGGGGDIVTVEIDVPPPVATATTPDDPGSGADVGCAIRSSPGSSIGSARSPTRSTFCAYHTGMSDARTGGIGEPTMNASAPDVLGPNRPSSTSAVHASSTPAICACFSVTVLLRFHDCWKSSTSCV